MTQRDNLADWPARAGAYLMDAIIPFAGLFLLMLGFAVAISIGLGDTPDLESRPQAPVWLAPVFLAGVIIIIGYAVWWFVSLKDGQTPGKKIIGIRVVRASDGETLGRGMMLVRELMTKFVLLAVIYATPIGTYLIFFFLPFDIFSNFIGVVTLCIVLLPNFLWPLWDAKSQTLHDKIVCTYVVYS